MTDMVFGLPVLVLAVLLAWAIGWLLSDVRSEQIVTSQHVQLGKLETERDLLLDRITEHEQLRDKQGHEFNQIQLKHTELLRQHSALSTSLDEKQLHFTEASSCAAGFNHDVGGQTVPSKLSLILE